MTPPDFNAIAQDLKGQGFTYQDIEKKGSEILNTAPEVTLQDPEGDRPSDKEFVMPVQEEQGTPASVQKLLQAYESIESEEAIPVQGAVKPPTVDREFAVQDMVDTDWASPTDISEAVIAPKTEGSNRELSEIIGTISGGDKEFIFGSLQDGDDMAYAKAVSEVEEAFNFNLSNFANERISAAGSSEEVLDILTDVKMGKRSKVDLSDLRAFSIGKMDGVLPERMGYITQHTVRNMYLAQEISKKENELAANTPFFSALGDFLEYAAPALGFASEEVSKYKQGIPEVLNRLDKASPETQMSVLEAAMQSWENQETLLIQNNNSFMTLAQFGALKDAILQGGLALSDVDATRAEKNQYIETIANAGFEVSGVFGAMDSVKSLIKYINLRSMSGYQNMNRKITPEVAQRAFDAMNPNNKSETTIQAQVKLETKFKEEPQYVDRRANLVKAASEKNTTLFRKTLEEEKKALGNEKSVISGIDYNAEARKLSKEKKIKFKSALKEIKEGTKEQVLIINRRLSAIQEHVDSFDTSARAEASLSQISQFLKDGRMKESDLFVPTGVVNVKPTTRTQSNLIDTEYLEIPYNKVKLEKEKGLKGIQEKSGLSKEEVAARAVPTPNNATERGMPNSIINRMELNDLVLSEGDVVSIGMGLAREVEKQAGTSLTPYHSATAFRGYADNDNSQGLFTFLMQDGNRGGFDDLVELESAARKGLAGYDYRIVEKDGKFFAEVDVEHYINPDIDTKGLYTDEKTAVGVAGKLTMTPLRILGEEVFKAIYAVKGVHRSRSQKIENKFKDAVGSLSSAQGKKLNDALTKGDLEEKEWISPNTFRRSTGVADKAVFEAYRAMREVYEDVYNIRNQNYYNKLRKGNVKFIDMDDGNLGTILNPKSSSDMKTFDDLVLDLETGTLIKADPNDGMSYVRLTNGVEDADTGLRYVVRLNSEKISALPLKVLNRRVGHIDRMYRDTGWIVKTPKTGRVEGQDVVLPSRVTHIVKTQGEADKIALEEGGVAQRSRENDELEAIFGNDSDIQFTYGSSHTKKRNEILSGPDGGEANILNAFESMAKTLAKTDFELGTNILQSLKSRFYNEFEGMLKEGKNTQFKERFQDMLKPNVRDTSSKGQVQELQNWHSYIKSVVAHEKGAMFKQFDEMISPVFDPILNAKNKLTGSSNSVDSGKVADAAQRMASEIYIVWNPLYQIPQNLAPSLYLSMAKGEGGVRSLIALGGLRRAFNKGDMGVLSKTLGVTTKQAEELIAELRSNGLVDAVGRSNDFLDLARGDINVGATSKPKAAIQKVKKYGYSGARDMMRGGQENVVAMMNIMSYMAEYKNFLKKGGVFDGKGKAEVSFQAQKNLQTQNSMDAPWYQSPSNVFRPAFQFMQYLQKYFVDLVLEPQYKIITGATETLLKQKFSEGKYFGKQAGPFAQSYAQALVTTALTYSVFGVAGGFGEKLGGIIEDKVRKNFPEFAQSDAGTSLMDGMLSATFNGTLKSLGVEGSVNITSTYGPAAFLDMFNDFFIEGFPEVNPFGVTGVLASSVVESVSSSVAIVNADEIDTPEKAYFVAAEILEIFPLFKNIEKAAVAMMFEQMPAASSLSGKAKVTFTEGLMLAANIQPDLVKDFYSKADFSKLDKNIWDLLKSEEWHKTIATGMLQASARALYLDALKTGTGNLVDGGGFDTGVTLKQREDNLRKYAGAAKSLIPKEGHRKVDKMFSERALASTTPTYAEYPPAYIKKGSPTDTGEWLNVLVQKANSQEAREMFESLQKNYDATDEMSKILEEKGK